MIASIIKYAGLFSAVAGALFLLLKILLFLHRHEKEIAALFRNQSITRDVFIIVLDILIFFVIPALTMWSVWDDPASAFRSVTLVVCGIVIVFNATALLFIWYMNKVIKDSLKK